MFSIFVSSMRKINRTYKFRLYPNKGQAELLARHFGCSRFVYNYFLNQRKEQYRLTGKSDNYYAQAKDAHRIEKAGSNRMVEGSKLPDIAVRYP